METPTTENAVEMQSYLGSADTLEKKPRRTQCTAETSGELKQAKCKYSKWNLTRITPFNLAKNTT